MRRRALKRFEYELESGLGLLTKGAEKAWLSINPMQVLRLYELLDYFP